MGQFSVSKAVQLQRRTLEYAMTNGYNCERDSQLINFWNFRIRPDTHYSNNDYQAADIQFLELLRSYLTRTLPFIVINDACAVDGQHGKVWSENHMVTVLAAKELLLRDG